MTTLTFSLSLLCQQRQKEAKRVTCIDVSLTMKPLENIQDRAVRSLKVKVFCLYSNGQEAQLLSHSLSITEKMSAVLSFGRSVGTAGRQRKPECGQGPGTKPFDHRNPLWPWNLFWQGKKCLLTYKFPGSLTKQLSFLSFPAKHVMFRGEEAESSSSFMLQNNFIHPEFSFMKIQGFVPSSGLLSPFAFSSFVYNVIISTNRKNRKGKFNAESENLWNIL